MDEDDRVSGDGTTVGGQEDPGVGGEAEALFTADDRINAEAIFSLALDYRLSFDRTCLRALYDRVGNELVRSDRQDRRIRSEGA